MVAHFSNHRARALPTGVAGLLAVRFEKNPDPGRVLTRC